MRRLDAVPKTAVLIGIASSAAALSIGFWIPVNAELAQVLLEHAWRQAQAGRPDPTPWPWADTSPVARLTIPSLKVSWIVLSGASGRNLAFAPSHMDGSAEPARPIDIGYPGSRSLTPRRHAYVSIVTGRTDCFCFSNDACDGSRPGACAGRHLVIYEGFDGIALGKSVFYSESLLSMHISTQKALSQGGMIDESNAAPI